MRRLGSSTQRLPHQVAALERTALAWERTAVSLAVVGTLLVKAVDGGRVLQAGGLALVGTAVAIVVLLVPVGYRRASARVDARAPGSSFTRPDRWRTVALLATAMAVSATALAVGADLWLSDLA